MRRVVAAMIVALGAGVAGAQIVPLGVPIMPQTKAAAPSQAQMQSGRMAPAAPIGANSQPANMRPQQAMSAQMQMTSALPRTSSPMSGAIAAPDSVGAATPAKKTTTNHPNALRDLAPKAPERTALPQADTAAPR